MSRESRSRRSKTMVNKPQGPSGTARLVIFIVVLALLGVSALLLYRSLTQTGEATEVELPISSSLNPVESVTLSLYITRNEEALNTSRTTVEDFRPFEIAPGETATSVGDLLLEQGFITDSELFINYMRYYGLERDIEAGVYSLSPSMTVPEIAQALTDSSTAQVTIRIPEGWRREQIADWLDTQPQVPFTGAEFLSVTADPANLADTVIVPGYVPAGVSLEGFLFPDTYQLRPDATASDLVGRMLITFDERVTPEMRQQAAAQGFTLYEVLTLASIVEREAAVIEERPQIASVYLNRLSIDMMLQADPTVQYAQGYDPTTGEWWNRGLTQADYTSVDSPYNTYLYAGLPPGPIANPSLSSIQAVLNPADTPYIFFRAACDGSGRHNFAITFEEHLANACQ